jgi:acetyl-CoA C-acetyltransferase
MVSKDEEYTNVKMDRIPTLKQYSQRRYCYCCASTINDGCSSIDLMSEEKALSLGLTFSFH